MNLDRTRPPVTWPSRQGQAEPSNAKNGNLASLLMTHQPTAKLDRGRRRRRSAQLWTHQRQPRTRRATFHVDARRVDNLSHLAVETSLTPGFAFPRGSTNDPHYLKSDADWYELAATAKRPASRAQPDMIDIKTPHSSPTRSSSHFSSTPAFVTAGSQGEQWAYCELGFRMKFGVIVKPALV